MKLGKSFMYNPTIYIVSGYQLYVNPEILDIPVGYGIKNELFWSFYNRVRQLRFNSFNALIHVNEIWK